MGSERRRSPECAATGEMRRFLAPERGGSTLKSHSWPTPVDGRAGQGADIRAGLRHMPLAGSRQFVEQRLHLFGIGSIHPGRSPRVDTLTAARVRERIASLPPGPVTRFVVFEPRAPAAFRRFLIRPASSSCRRYFTLILATSRT